MHRLRFAFALGEEDPIKRLDKALLICEGVMNVLFKNKNVLVKIKFWQPRQWRVSQIMLSIYDLINYSNSAEIKNIIEDGKLSAIDISIKTKKYNFDIIKGMLNILLSAELGIFAYIDMSMEFSIGDNIIFCPYDDRGAYTILKSKKLYNILVDEFSYNIIEK